jgi:hypothetical protein
MLLSACSADITAPVLPTKDTIYVNDGATPLRTIYGYVELQNNCQLLANVQGVKVTIDSLGLTTTTDRSGRFSFSGLQWQPYTLTYEKGGYHTVRERQWVGMSNTGLQFGTARLDNHWNGSAKFVGDTTMSMYKERLDIDTMMTDSNGIRYRYRVPRYVNKYFINFFVAGVDSVGDISNNSGYIYLLLSRTANIDPQDSSTYLYARKEDTDIGDRNVFLMSDDLESFGFKPGDTYYVALTARSYCASTGFGRRSEVREYQVPKL